MQAVDEALQIAVDADDGDDVAGRFERGGDLGDDDVRFARLLALQPTEDGDSHAFDCLHDASHFH